MKHIEEYGKIDESSLPKFLKSLRYKKYSVENDNFIREVWCKQKSLYLTEGKKYRLYAEFETGAMLTGKCFVVFNDNKEFMGFDSDYFMEEWQWTATKKYNL
jgi:hypothetical protein